MNIEGNLREMRRHHGGNADFSDGARGGAGRRGAGRGDGFFFDWGAGTNFMAGKEGKQMRKALY